MNRDNDKIERQVEKSFEIKDKRKRKRMGVSGKQVFQLQKLLDRQGKPSKVKPSKKTKSKRKHL